MVESGWVAPQPATMALVPGSGSWSLKGRQTGLTCQSYIAGRSSLKKAKYGRLRNFSYSSFTFAGFLGTKDFWVSSKWSRCLYDIESVPSPMKGQWIALQAWKSWIKLSAVSAPWERPRHICQPGAWTRSRGANESSLRWFSDEEEAPHCCIANTHRGKQPHPVIKAGLT